MTSNPISPELVRPPVLEVYEILRKHNALIVHFSGAPKGSGVNRENHLYPTDLKYAISGAAQGGLSCSTVMPRDRFFGDYRNATGCIGIILGLRNSKSLVGAFPYDCGSIEDDSNQRSAPSQVELTTEHIESTIVDRIPNSYNEWIVKDYEVIGIFATKPFEIAALMKLELPLEARDYMEVEDLLVEGLGNTTIREVCNEFCGMPVYGFHNENICKWDAEVPLPCKHEDIYAL